jgi:hypothetical protein
MKGRRARKAVGPSYFPSGPIALSEGISYGLANYIMHRGKVQ